MTLEGSALPVVGAVAGCVVIAVAGVAIARSQRHRLVSNEEGLSTNTNAMAQHDSFLQANQGGPSSMPPPLAVLGTNAAGPGSAGPESAGTPWSDAPTSATSITFSEHVHHSPLYSTMVSPVGTVGESPTSGVETNSMKRARMLLGLAHHH
ncbi:hypothetical protein HDU77_005646 [Chytriomyces hyalinus]|nr:hypothetical protein HDU77_005646 [Chytriomyces hyalinus]